MKVYQKILVFLGIIFLIGGLFIFVSYRSYKKLLKNSWEETKFGFVTDIEYGYKNSIGNKLTKMGLTELEKVVDFYNKEFHPDFVVEGGDMVESSLAKKKTTIEQFGKINKVFSRLDAKREYVLGNHDLRNLNKEEVRNLLGMDDNYKYFDQGGWRFIILDTNFNDKGEDRGPSFYNGSRVSQNELNWLKEVLKTEKPVVIFSHHPFIPLSDRNLKNADKVISVFEKHRNVVLTVSGHNPNFYFNEQNGINYLVVDNIANKDSIGSFASFEAKYNKYTKEAEIKIEHYGPTRETKEVNRKLGKTLSFKEYLFTFFQPLYQHL